jgi:hypothetical protein
MTSKSTRQATPLRFGVVAPITTDVPTWLDQLRGLAGSGYSTILMPDVPQWQPAPGPALAVAATITDLRVATWVYASRCGRHGAPRGKSLAEVGSDWVTQLGADGLHHRHAVGTRRRSPHGAGVRQTANLDSTVAVLPTESKLCEPSTSTDSEGPMSCWTQALVH